MRVMSLIHGNLSDHYTRVWDYGHELLRSNPNITVRITVTVNLDNTTSFHRFYICFKAIREGWKRACRRGLVEASKDNLPYVEHRQCARHIYANFRKVYSGVQAISYAAYDHLMAREPTSWCRAYFFTGLACEAVENGIVECFNAIIVDARNKPFLTMLEEIMIYMMERAFNLKQEAEKWVGEVCSSAITKMEEFGEDIKGHNKTSCKNPIVVPEPQPKKKMGRPRLEPNLLNWSGTKTGSKGGGRAGGRVGGGRSRGGGRGSSGRGNRGGGRGSSEGVQTEYGEGTSEFPKCEPELVAIPNVESENDASPYFHNHMSLTIDNLRNLYTLQKRSWTVLDFVK
ncbi:unnamed protein product [Lactuca saligna]|uniref:Uncharacterized protein n=1 Tax=Lactuca saligna TaxID=75948 RepID=A0AA35VRA3_LACSI|nr:unnamed protein product [Lactuca saligna]